MALVSALQADTFVDSVGVNVHSWFHIDDPGNAYGNTVWPKLVSSLNIRHVRDGYVSTTGDGRRQVQAARVTDLEKLGVDVLYILNSTGISANTTTLNAFVSTVMPTPLGVEPWNEYDANATRGVLGDGGWISDITTFQPTIYSTIKAKYPNVPVLGASLATPSRNSLLTSTEPNLDINNIHLYNRPGQPPEYIPNYNSTNLSLHRTQGPTKPIWVTEHGLVYGNGQDLYETTESIAAKLLVRNLFVLWAPTTLASVKTNPFSTGIGGMGATKTFIYELFDQHYPPSLTRPTEDGFGLYYYNGVPKAAVTSIKNTLGLLMDRGPNFTPGALDITTSGLDASTSYILFQKRDGSFWIAYWRSGGTVANGLVNDSPEVLADPAPSFGMTFGQTFRRLINYRPNISPEPVTTTLNTNTVTLNARQDVQILKLTNDHQTGRANLYRRYVDSR